jgi:hypothetical protein
MTNRRAILANNAPGTSAIRVCLSSIHPLCKGDSTDGLTYRSRHSWLTEQCGRTAQALLTLRVEHGDATTPTSELGIPLKQRREARQYLCVPPLALLVLTKRVRASTASRCRCSFHPHLSWKAVCRWVEAHRARHPRVAHRYWEFSWRRIEIDVCRRFCFWSGRETREALV